MRLLLLVLLALTACTRPAVKPDPVVKQPFQETRHCPPLAQLFPPAPRPFTPGPPEQPFLRLDPGMHTAPINRIDTDAAGRFAVTASDDKTVRVWSLSGNCLLDVLRPPIGEGDEGKLYAVAMSPDGVWVATGGWSQVGSNDIYLFHRSSVQLRQRIRGLPNVIFHLAFSADGRYLAAALGAGNGIRVYENLAGLAWRETARDTDYGDGSYWVEFAADGRLLSSCLDGHLRLYGADFRLQHKLKAPGDERPAAARFSPDSSRIAVGFNDSTHIAVLDGYDLSVLFHADTQGVDNGDLGSIAWSADGQMLWASGRYRKGDRLSVLSWPQAGRGPRRERPASFNTLMDLRALPDGGLLFGAQDPLLGRFDASGGKIILGTPPIADFRANYEGFSVSDDGSTVQFGYEPGGKSPALFQVAEMALQTARDNLPGREVIPALHPPRTSGLDISGWKDTTEPRLNGQPLPLKNYETSRSLAIASDNAGFLLGTEWNLRYFDRQGRQRWQQDVPGVAWGVNITPDNRKAVAAFGDGTLRWYRLSNGQELLAFYPHPDKKRWVAWTPEGFFAHAPGAEALIGYHLNQGADREGVFIGVDQVYDLFYRPDLVVAKFRGEEDVVQQALAGMGDIRKVLLRGLPPALALPDGAKLTLASREHVLKVALADRGGGIGRIEVKINGKTLAPATARPFLGGYQLPVSLADGANHVEVTAYNAAEQVAARTVKQVIHVKLPAPEKPDLYLLAVGINAYRDAELRLKFAAPDATAVHGQFHRQGRKLYKTLHTRLLTDHQAHRAGIEAALDRIASLAQPEDVFVFYLSGHGLAEDGRYYFLPQDLIYRNPKDLERNSLDQDFIATKLKAIPARKTVLILDTCYAGQATGFRGAPPGLATKTALGRLMRTTGTAVLAATGKRQMALEGYQGHGVFTYALLEGLRGAADRLERDGQVWIDELATYLGNKVPAITKTRFAYEQFPMYDLRGQAFPLVVVE